MAVASQSRAQSRGQPGEVGIPWLADNHGVAQ